MSSWRDFGTLPTSVGYKTATIASGASESGVIDMGCATPVRIEMPASWTAANLRILVEAVDGATYTALQDVYGNAIELSGLDASEQIVLDPNEMLSVRRFKLKSVNTDGTGAAVNQAAERTLYVWGWVSTPGM